MSNEYPNGYRDFTCLARVEFPPHSAIWAATTPIDVEKPTEIIQKLNLDGDDISIQYPVDEFIYDMKYPQIFDATYYKRLGTEIAGRYAISKALLVSGDKAVTMFNKNTIGIFSNPTPIHQHISKISQQGYIYLVYEDNIYSKLNGNTYDPEKAFELRFAEADQDACARLAETANQKTIKNLVGVSKYKFSICDKSAEAPQFRAGLCDDDVIKNIKQQQEQEQKQNESSLACHSMVLCKAGVLPIPVSKTSQQFSICSREFSKNDDNTKNNWHQMAVVIPTSDNPCPEGTTYLDFHNCKSKKFNEFELADLGIQDINTWQKWGDREWVWRITGVTDETENSLKTTPQCIAYKFGRDKDLRRPFIQFAYPAGASDKEGQDGQTRLVTCCLESDKAIKSSTNNNGLQYDKIRSKSIISWDDFYSFREQQLPNQQAEASEPQQQTGDKSDQAESESADSSAGGISARIAHHIQQTVVIFSAFAGIAILFVVPSYFLARLFDL